MRSEQGQHWQRGHNRNHVLLVCVAVAALSSSCAAAPQRPAINAALAQLCTAELTAAQVDHRQTLDKAEAARVAGTLTGARLERVRTAGKALDSAMLKFDAELDLFIAGGGESSTFSLARAEMAQARTNLALTWEAVKRGNP